MSPGPIEEWIFFDHPSGRSRIYAAMRWKAENLNLFAAASVSPCGDGRPRRPGRARLGLRRGHGKQ